MVFSIDEWMVSLFGEDAPQDLTPGWVQPRVERCENQMRRTVLQLAARGVPSILDLGFQNSKHRQAYFEFAKESGLPIKLHFLDVDANIRWLRVDARNNHKGDTHHLNISRPMFDYIESIWEPPTLAELTASQGKRIVAQF